MSKRVASITALTLQDILHLEAGYVALVTKLGAGSTLLQLQLRVTSVSCERSAPDEEDQRLVDHQFFSVALGVPSVQQGQLCTINKEHS